MNLVDLLEKYKKYANGDLTSACKLEVEDEVIKDFDFSKYDLNNSYFGGVQFCDCNFSNVYLSGSNFGGSSFIRCQFNNNELVKAEWDDVTISDTVISSLKSKRSSFMYGKFTNVKILGGTFEGCMFDNSSMDNVIFEKCKISSTSFDGCTFSNVTFIDCLIETHKFDDIEGVFIR